MVISGRNLVSERDKQICKIINIIYVIIFAGDISSIAKVYGKAVDRNGETFMDIEKIIIDFTMKNARFKVKDNVNSQNVLGK